jgi:transposase
LKHVKFSEDFKKTIVQKVLSPGARTKAEILDEAGVARSSIYDWINKYGKTVSMNNTTPKSSQKLSPEEKLQLVFEYLKLNESEQGAFLRENGLHSQDIAQWKDQMKSVFVTTPINRTEQNNDKKKIKKLEAELHRKDKALAEAAALIILKKKADLLWGSEDDE